MRENVDLLGEEPQHPPSKGLMVRAPGTGL